MSENTIRIGIVGCGWIAEYGHIPAFKLLKNVEIVSAYDIDMTRADKLAKTFGIKHVCEDYGRFLTSGLDAVIISTPNYSHSEYALAAIEHDKHVLCEKPFTISLSETQKLLTAAETHNTVILPGFVNRFRDDIKQLMESIHTHIGTIRKIDAGWIRKDGAPRPGTWFTSKNMAGGGVLIDLGSHIVDLCLMIAGPQTIQDASLQTYYQLTNQSTSASWFNCAYDHDLPINVEDTAVVDVNFCSHLDLQIKLSWLAPVDGDYTYFSVYGDHGRVELKTLFGFSDQRRWKEDTITISKNNDVETIPLVTPCHKAADAFYHMGRFFIDQITNDTPADTITIHDGYNTVDLIERLYACENKSDSGQLTREKFNYD